MSYTLSGYSQNDSIRFSGPVNYPVGNQPNSLAVGVLGSNHNFLLGITAQGTNDLSVLIGNGRGEFSGPINFSSGGVRPNSIASNDLNSDGNSDLVVTADPIIINHYGNGNGEFPNSSSVYNGSSAISEATLGDFNNDGNTDLAGVFVTSFGAVSVLLGTSSGSFSRYGNFSASSILHSEPIALAAADMDGDNQDDLVVANKDSNPFTVLPGHISVLWADSVGSFYTHSIVGAGLNLNPNSVTVADVDYDGILDIVATNPYANNVMIFKGEGNRGFSEPVFYSVDASPSSVISEDFNGDGLIDLAVTNQSSDNVSILLGDEFGSFSDPFNFAVGTDPIKIVAGDFNNDGAIDLATANKTSNDVSILLNLTEIDLFLIDSILIPENPVNADLTFLPKAIIQNLSGDTLSGNVVAQFYEFYYDSLQLKAIPPFKSDTVTFKSWTPQILASGNFTCSSSSDSGLVDHDKRLLVLSDASGFYIDTILPNKILNEGVEEITIHGSGFQSGSEIRLISGNDIIEIINDNIQYISSDKLVISLNAKDIPESNWHIELAKPSGVKTVYYDGLAIVEFEGQKISFNRWEEFHVKQGTSINVGVYIPSGLNDLFLLMKKTTHIGYSGTWKGGYELIKNKESVVKESGSGDFDFHLKNPEQGWYELKIWSSDPGDGFIKLCSALDTLELGEWRVNEVLRPYGNDWTHVDVPEGQETLFFETEGIGLWSGFDVWYGSIGNDTAHWYFNNWGKGYHIEGKIENPNTGRYYIKYMDSGVMQQTNTQTREYMIIADTKPVEDPAPIEPVITGLSTYEVGQGPVTLNLYGNGLNPAASVSIEIDSIHYVEALNVLGDTSMRQLTASFNIPSDIIGDFFLRVTNPNGNYIKSIDPININSNSESNLKIEIYGRSMIRVGRYSTYTFTVENTGNIDVRYPYVLISVPENYKYEVDLPEAYPTDAITDASTIIVYLKSLFASEKKSFNIKFYSPEFNATQINASLIVSFPTKNDNQLNANAEYSKSAYSGQALRDPEPGEFVFREFSILPNLPPTRYPAHIGIYCEDENGDGWVVDFTNKNGGSIWVTPFDEWKIKNGSNTYIGASHPPDWTATRGAEIGKDVWETYRLRNGEYVGNYRVIPNDDTDNCLSWLARLFKEFDLPFAWNRITEPIALYDFWEFINPLLDLFPSFYPTNTDDWGDLISEYGRDSFSFPLTPVSSSTPEDKYGICGYGENGYTSNDQKHLYKIDFWNHDTASANAQEVFIRDTLDTDFNDTTLSFVEVGFLRWEVPLQGGQYFNVNVDMRPDMDLIVNVEGQYDRDSREIYWVFRSLDPISLDYPEDPLAGFLPPIDSTGYQIGWVEYEIKPNKNLPDGTQLTNQAWVNFDGVGPTNPAPKEAPWGNTIDDIPPVSFVESLPSSTSSDSVLVSWNGDDVGAGIKNYTIYVSEDNSNYLPWVSDFYGNNQYFYGEHGKTYYFYSIAADNVGLVEGLKFDYEASIHFESSSSIDDNRIEEVFGDIEIFPNPSECCFTIISNLICAGEKSIEVINILGESIMQKQFTQNETTIDLSNSAEGIYYVKVRCGNTQKVRKIITY